LLGLSFAVDEASFYHRLGVFLDREGEIVEGDWWREGRWRRECTWEVVAEGGETVNRAMVAVQLKDLNIRVLQKCCSPSKHC